MRVTKPNESRPTNQSEITYPLWPEDGNAKATIIEWENGEGYDLNLNGTKIELTTYELETICALYHLQAIETFIERQAR